MTDINELSNIFIPSPDAKVFHIVKKSENLKNVKRVSPKRKIKGQKEWNGQKMKEMNPKPKKDHESVQVQKSTTFSFSVNKALRAAC